jgi:3-methyl-2-oxobutanoate hydroxymethyltransferase
MPRVRTTTFLKRKQAGEKLVVLTAYDYPTAKILDEAGVDCLLVGDSVATTVQGRPDTLRVTMDMMVYHTEMVSRAATHALVIGDMPFLSYQISPEEAVRNAGRFVAEGGAHGVKIEGPVDRFGEAIKAVLRAGIPVMGHIGLTPQSVHQIGGYKVQGRDLDAGNRLLSEAKALEEVGCFALVLELVQADIAAEITAAIGIPTIGIGSGARCDGQVLIVYDILGYEAPMKFVKVFADVPGAIRNAVETYISEVKSGTFPGKEHEF